ncbi:DoxX family protein [Simkania sp.]|uniref:DoxX family protein n=1 Tax=Simkania sp. TaxID=34094 RepID=UPI003B5195AD
MHDFFSKLGHYKRQVVWLPIFVTRIGIGIFFILSGFFKLFDAEQHEKLLKTMISANIPFPEFNSYFVPLIELLGGALILIGLLTSLSALVLLIVMVTAIVTERIAAVAMHGGLLLVENFFYLPEVLYALIFFWLFFSGPGKVSFDYVIGKKKRMSSY